MAKRRKTKKPWKPGEAVPVQSVEAISQLGLPTPQRAQHSEFDADNLAPNSPFGVFRARPKVLFLLPEQRQVLIEQALRDMHAKGHFEIKPGDVILPQTSMDRNFTPGEYDAICWFIAVHARIEGTGRPSITNYEGGPRGNSHDKLPFSEEEQYNRREYAHVASRLPEAHLVFLTWVAWCMYPEEFEGRGKPPSKVDFAGSMYDAEEAKYLRGAADGNFKAICQNVAHWRADYDIWQRRTALIHRSLQESRKKLAQ